MLLGKKMLSKRCHYNRASRTAKDSTAHYVGTIFRLFGADRDPRPLSLSKAALRISVFPDSDTAIIRVCRHLPFYFCIYV